MAEETRVVMVVTSLNNVFVEAWLATLRAAHDQAAVLHVVQSGTNPDIPDELAESVVQVVATDVQSARAPLEALLGGAPTALFHWWGLHAFQRSVSDVWPHARNVLCIDTYPNASRPLTELREWLAAISTVGNVDGFVTTSTAMSDILSKRFRLPASRFLAVPSPFPLLSHAEDRSADTFMLGSACFVGRSDFIAVGSKSMIKDDVSQQLAQVQRAGYEIFVQEPTQDLRNEFKRRGLKTYERATRADLMNGTFATMLASHHLNLAIYNPSNSTIRRRVSTGLSTRFATALSTPSFITVNQEATFALNFFTGSPIGSSMQGLRNPSDHAHEATLARTYWKSHHHEWSGEAVADQLAEFFKREY